MQEEKFRLKDSRLLAYCFYGSPTGKPVLYFHGTPSSRLEPMILGTYGIDLDTILMAADSRLIAIDRPGMGGSDLDPQGDFLAFASDVHELCAALTIEQCEVLCWSGGGPYALAMSYKYPELIAGCHIICGFSRPFDRDVEQLMGMNKWYFRSARRVPWFLRSAMKLLSKKRVNRAIPQWVTGLPYADYKLIGEANLLEKLSQYSMKEAVKNGAAGAVQEARGYYRPLGFQLSRIKVAVHYWWGLLDMSVIRLHAEAVEQEVPGAVMHYREGEGHLSLYVNAFASVMEVISSLRAAGKGIA